MEEQNMMTSCTKEELINKIYILERLCKDQKQKIKTMTNGRWDEFSFHRRCDKCNGALHGTRHNSIMFYCKDCGNKQKAKEKLEQMVHQCNKTVTEMKDMLRYHLSSPVVQDAKKDFEALAKY